MTYFITPKVSDLCCRFDLVYDSKRSRGHGMTKKVTVTFVVGLTYFMTPKVHGVNRGHRDLLYDSRGHGDLCRRFDLLYDPKRSRSH